MKVDYKPFPLTDPHPAFPGQSSHWMPMVNVSLVIRHARTNRFEVVVDSGSATCLFHAQIGRSVGLRIETGAEGPLGGVIGGTTGKVYYHEVKLVFAGDMIPIMAGFSDDLAVAGLLGRSGFFEHFIVTFDPCAVPPGMEIQRIHRA